MKKQARYIDPLMTTLDMPAVRPCPGPTPEQHRNRQLERMSREAGWFASRWAELEQRQEQALQRFDRDLATICARLEGSTNG